MGGWKEEGTAGDLAFTSSTRVQSDSTLVLPFPATSGPVEVSLTALAPAVSGQRGLNFGLGWFRPEQDGYRSVYLTFGGSGQILFWDPGMIPERSSNVGAYEQGKPTRIRLLADPTLGAFTIEVNGHSSPNLYPFFAGTPRLDSLFFTNYSTRAEDSPLRVSDIHVSAYPAPITPRGVTVRPLSPTGAEVAWQPSPGANGYRIYRLGRRVGEVSASQRFWREGGLPAGRPVAYNVAAIDAKGRESLPSWPVDALLPLDFRQKCIPKRYDVVVVGGTPSGISAAISAARSGANVLLAVPDDHLGGMMTGGLGRTDFRYKGAQRGLFEEFTRRVQQYYNDAYGPDSRTAYEASDGYNFEASVARAVFERMLDEEPRVTVRYGLQPVEAKKRNNRLVAVSFEGGSRQRETIPADAFIDATYEGDLMALARVKYRVGRESRAEFNEAHAGVIYWDVDKMDFLPGSTGEGDRRVQAYNYRLPLTNRAGHRYYPVKMPPDYDRSRYANIPDDVKAGRVQSVERVLHYRRVPGEEFDVNNNRYYPSTDDVGHSDDYPDASPAQRARIAEDHRRFIEGLIYFLQNDPELPARFRFEANQWGFAQDEFGRNAHFPNQLYVREGRRMVGAYTFNENDAEPAPGSARTPAFTDSIAVGDYMMDSHATRPQESDRPMGVLEGFFFIPALTKPYQIPYRILLPETVDGLLVPIAVSATHVGYGTLRMEPVMMAMGEAAGAATHIARRHHVELRKVNVEELKEVLLKRRAVLTFFSDLPPVCPDYEAFQYLGTFGFFDSYTVKPDDAVDHPTAALWFHRMVERIFHALYIPGDQALPWEKPLDNGPLSMEEARQWLEMLPGGKASISLLKPTKSGDSASSITRGSLIQALYLVSSKRVEDSGSVQVK